MSEIVAVDCDCEKIAVQVQSANGFHAGDPDHFDRLKVLTEQFECCPALIE